MEFYRSCRSSLNHLKPGFVHGYLLVCYSGMMCLSRSLHCDHKTPHVIMTVKDQ